MDFSTYKPHVDAHEEGRSVGIVGPGGEATDAQWWIVGPLSRRYRIAQIEASESVPFSEDEEEKRSRAERMDDWSTEILCRCVVRWENTQWEGKELECTVENVRKILQAYPWIKENLNRAQNQMMGFTSA